MLVVDENNLLLLHLSEAYSEHSQIIKIKLFANIVNSWKSLTVFAKNSVLDVWQSSEHTAGFCMERNKYM